MNTYNFAFAIGLFNLHGMCFYLYLCSEILRKTENKD